jgi:hypothetical protein
MDAPLVWTHHGALVGEHPHAARRGLLGDAHREGVGGGFDAEDGHERLQPLVPFGRAAPTEPPIAPMTPIWLRHR